MQVDKEPAVTVYTPRDESLGAMVLWIRIQIFMDSNLEKYTDPAGTGFRCGRRMIESGGGGPVRGFV